MKGYVSVVCAFLALSASAQGQTYAPGGHAIIPTYQSPPQQYAPPVRYSAPTYTLPPANYVPNQQPTYAPGGHAIIPSVPQPSYGQSYAPAARPQFAAPTFSQPFRASGPTYTPGSHAIIPTVPHSAPAFSTQFNNSARSAPAAQPSHPATSSQPHFSSTYTAPKSSTSRYNQPSPRGPSTTVARPLNSFQSVGGQSTPATVGVVPAQTQSRLQFTPLPQQSPGQLVKDTITGLPAGISVRAAATTPTASSMVQFGANRVQQGISWENYLQGTLNATRLPSNFKTFDFWNSKSRTAISAKTLDTGAPGYLKNPSAVYNTVRSYINAVVDFTKSKGGPVVLKAEDIVTKEIQLAVRAPTPAQVQQIEKAAEFAAQRGVNLVVTDVQAIAPEVEGVAGAIPIP